MPKPNLNELIKNLKQQPKEEEVPDLRQLVPNASDRLKLLRLISEDAALGLAASRAKAQRKPLRDQINPLLEKYKVRECVADGYRVSRYCSTKRTLNQGKLLNAGVSPTIIAACIDEKESWTLRIVGPGEVDNGEES
jgi:hypothetical protein